MSPLHAVRDLPPDDPAPSVRLCDVPDCGKKHKARGYCQGHVARWRRYGDPLGGSSLADNQWLIIEDVEWMAEHGESLEGAAKRLDRKPGTLERALDRAARPDLVAQLRRRVSVAS
jgi:hypothetical protein